MSPSIDTVVPSWIAVALGVATVCLIVAIVLIGLRARKSRKTNDLTTQNEKVLRRLFIAAVIPTLGVIGAVMAISFVGLSSFAEHDMGWHSWLRFIVPLSLDGISITFGFWAFVAVKRGRHPGRAEKIVIIGAAISAWINYSHGSQQWTGAAGLYLGFLSLASAWMFHELLAQFMDSHEHLPNTRNGVPAFGERWIWAPISTLTARRAWIVYPPAETVVPSVRNALKHHQDLKELKRKDRLIRASQVQEEQQARLVEVRARNEVKQERAAGRRVVEPAGPPLPAPVDQPSPEPAAAPVPVLAQIPLPAPQFTPGQVGGPHMAGYPQQTQIPHQPQGYPAYAYPAQGPAEGPAMPPPPQPSPVDMSAVPKTVATVERWLSVALQLATDGYQDGRPITLSDADSSDTFGVTARTLRDVRNAASGGALFIRADELGIAVDHDLRSGWGHSRISDRLAPVGGR